MRPEALDQDVADARRTGVEADQRGPSTRVSRSFAFIDLCGFTDFADLHGDDAAVAELRILRANVREAAGAAGVRVDKWLGDGVMLVGVEPQPLVTAVIALRRHHEERGCLPVRGGLATGPVILLDGDDYVGRAVNLAARLCERAEPDQILAATDDGLTLPADVHATSAASFHIKGFVSPVAVVALSADPSGSPVPLR
jgi:adenylate cyclase